MSLNCVAGGREVVVFEDPETCIVHRRRRGVCRGNVPQKPAATGYGWDE